MKKRINVQMLAIASTAIVLTLFMATAVFYELFQKEIYEDLKTYTSVLEAAGNLEDIEKYGAKINNLRITIIDSDGSVEYDSNAQIVDMDNHGKRPEVAEAFDNGFGEAVRRSKTMDKSTFYYALLLDNGCVLRVAKESQSIWSVFQSSFPAIMIITIMLFVICYFMAYLLTKTMMKPIENMAKDMDDPENGEIYKELVPFITTIQKQHADILKNAKMRQEFTANVSHELKTPLTAIAGYSELIESGMAADEDVVRFAGEIHSNSDRLLTLINDIIRLSELDVEERVVSYEMMDLYDIATRCVEMLSVNAKNHNVTLELSGYSCIIDANKEMMNELVYNLCDNAIRYNNPEGKVMVSVYDENDHAVLSVKDNGIGISKENQQRIFERFYRVDKSRSKSTGGTGLGLAIVKHIVSQHNADIQIESEPLVGTEIKVKF